MSLTMEEKDKDYNTQRKKLLMPEYGRNVQKMVEYVKHIPDREKRNEQIKAVVGVMGTLNPQLRDIEDFKHKLWDHVQIIADFDIDIDSPYDIPTRDIITSKPDPMDINRTPISARHYGRNIENMIEVIATKEDGDVKDAMIKSLAVYMRQQYLIWNKDTVSEETIFNDIRLISKGKLLVPEYIHLDTISEKEVFNRPGIMGQKEGQTSRSQHNHRNKNGKKRWKK